MIQGVDTVHNVCTTLPVVGIKNYTAEEQSISVHASRQITIDDHGRISSARTFHAQEGYDTEGQSTQLSTVMIFDFWLVFYRSICTSRSSVIYYGLFQVVGANLPPLYCDHQGIGYCFVQQLQSI